LLDFFVSGFVYHGITWSQLLVGIGLGIIFGAFWYAAYWTPILGRPWPWAVLAGSAFLSWAALVLIQIPLQTWTRQAMSLFWGQDIILRRLIIAGIPLVLISGLVQEGSKLLPVVIFWWRKGKNIDPKLGLVLGAAAGLGFGVFEAVWIHNSVFISGWSWEAVRVYGLLLAILPFLERFFTVAFHTAASAIAGWGLAKGWGWQFYLIASLAHTLLNYNAVFFQAGILDQLQIEVIVAIFSLMITAVALWLRYRRQRKQLDINQTVYIP
jgi:RsiW-degrading membrane proteinase PrsW (M82 family)